MAVGRQAFPSSFRGYVTCREGVLLFSETQGQASFQYFFSAFHLDILVKNQSFLHQLSSFHIISNWCFSVF